MCYHTRPTNIVILIYIIFVQKYINAFEPYLNVSIFPVGEGDATIVECNDKPGNATLTLINAGSMNTRKGEIRYEYFKFLKNKLKNSHYYIKNIILTNSEPKHYNFIESLMIFIKEEDVKNITFYIGGERSSYISLDHIFQTYDNVYEFTREKEVDGKVSSCGHLDKNDYFHTCVKRSKRGPIAKSNQVIQICDNFQISIMAANYGFSKDYKEEQAKSVIDRNYKNSLILKITPSEHQSPSVLLGDFGNDLEDGDISSKYSNFIKQAHNYYFTRSSHVPISLWDGLTSTVIKIPRNGAITTSTQNENFYSVFVKPKYAVISSDITDLHGHPRCSVLRLLDKYITKFSAARKKLQCHNRKPKDLEDTQVLELSDNLYQTTTIVADEHSRAEVAFNLITFKMTLKDISKPVEGPLSRNKRYDLGVNDVTYPSVRVSKNKAPMVQHLINISQVANVSDGYFHGDPEKRLVKYARRITNTFKGRNLSEFNSRSKMHDRCINESQFESGEYIRNCSRERISNVHSEKGRDGQVKTKNLNRNEKNRQCINAIGGKVDASNNRNHSNGSDDFYDINNGCLTILPTSKQYIKGKNKSEVVNKSGLSSDSEKIESILYLFSNSDKNSNKNYSIKKYDNNGSNSSKKKGHKGEYRRKHKKHAVVHYNAVHKGNYTTHSFKKYTITGKNQEDVSGLNDVSHDEGKLDNYGPHKQKYNEKEEDGNMNNEYREDIIKHNEHTYHREEDESNNYSNEIEKHNNRDNFNDAIDDMSLHMRRYNEYPSYESTPGRDNDNVPSDEFDYQHGSRDPYPNRDLLYQSESDRVGGDAYANGLDYDGRDKEDQHNINERRRDKEKESPKYSETEYESTLRDGTYPQKFESVSNEYPTYNDHGRQTPYYVGHGEDETDDSLHFHYRPSRDSGRGMEEAVGIHEEEMENHYKPTHHGYHHDDDFDYIFEKIGDKQSSERPRHTTADVTKDMMVKTSAPIIRWGSLTTNTYISPSTTQENHVNTRFPHTHQWRKGIPTPEQEKMQRQVSLTHKPTVSFREASHNAHTKEIHNVRATPEASHHRMKDTHVHHKTTKHTRKPTTQRILRTRGKSTKKSRASKNTASKGGHQKEKPPPPLEKKLHTATTLNIPLHDPKKINILCFGDSLTAGYNKRGKDFFPYCSALKDMLSVKTDIPLHVDIRGIVGEMTHKQMAYRLPLVLGNATSHYDWIIILGGTNDILHVKNFADDQYFLSQLENVWQPRIEKDIEKLHLISYKYNARTMLLTVPENAIESWPEYKPLRKMRNRINEALKSFASSSNGRTVLCDTAKNVPRHSLSSEQESLLWDDHVHMTRDGYRKLAGAVSECLGPYLPHKSARKKSLSRSI